MELNLVTIKAVSNLFTLNELQTELEKATMAMLQQPDKIISATTGAGSSYTKQISMSAQELVELLSYALEYKQTGTISSDGSNIMYTVTFLP